MYPLQRELQGLLTLPVKDRCGAVSAKVFSTPSGEYYAYEPSTNRIFTVSREFSDSLPPANKDALVLDGLTECGIFSPAPLSSPVWRLSAAEYFRAIEDSVPSLVLETTRRCNLRCSYCVYSGDFEHERSHGSLQMSAETARESILFYYEHSAAVPKASISFYGGEPLLNFDVVREAVGYARALFGKKPLRFDISTNGTLFDRAVLEWLLSNPDVTVTVTLNGYEQDIYRRFPGGGGSLETIMAGLELMRAEYPAVWEGQLRFICNFADAAGLLSLRDFYRERVGRLPSLITGITSHGGGERIKNLLFRNAQDERRAFERIRQLYVETDDPFLRVYFQPRLSAIHSRPITLSDDPPRVGSCMPFLAKLFVGADGCFGICEKVCQQRGLGGVREGFNLAALKKLLEETGELAAEKCSVCWARRLCGLCFRELMEGASPTRHIDEPLCERERGRLSDDLSLYCAVAEQDAERLSRCGYDWQTSRWMDLRAGWRALKERAWRACSAPRA